VAPDSPGVVQELRTTARSRVLNKILLIIRLSFILFPSLKVGRAFRNIVYGINESYYD